MSDATHAAVLREPDDDIGAVPIAPSEPEPAPHFPMVGWYDPGQLARTGVEVAISTVFGRHSDHRLLESMAAGDTDKRFYDYTCHYADDGEARCEPRTDQRRTSIWIDYVGDVGDGWNATYAIACHLATARRAFAYWNPAARQSCTAPTERGAILVFGGDEVYPTPSHEGYKDRLLGPYLTALRRSESPHPHAFAIPGNHDWYDSLVSFNRLFTSHRWFAGWRTQQTRSYFALKLPHNWWLLGTDVQLGSDIDGPQMRYFESLVPEMNAEEQRSGTPASIILCNAEPHWIRSAQYGGFDPNYNESNLKALEKRLGKDVAVFIAGDLHHYRRHEALDGSTQKITAGGGGAFLHPTHVGALGTSLDVIYEDTGPASAEQKAKRPDEVFTLRASFPPPEASRRLTWANLVFPYLPGSANRWLGAATAVLYLLVTFGVVMEMDTLVGRSYSAATILGAALQQIVDGGVTALLVVLVIVGFMFFTDTHSPRYRIIMGSLHGSAHIAAAFAIAVLSVAFVAHHLDKTTWSWSVAIGGVSFAPDARLLVAVLLILLGGYVVGPLILGGYLILSLNFFGRHSNEAFSALGVEDWKNCLRLHIDEHGDLTIYAIGIKRVPRRWKRRAGQTGPELVPDDLRATNPELIEPPIFIRRTNATPTGVEAARRE